LERNNNNNKNDKNTINNNNSNSNNVINNRNSDSISVDSQMLMEILERDPDPININKEKKENRSMKAGNTSVHNKEENRKDDIRRNEIQVHKRSRHVLLGNNNDSKNTSIKHHRRSLSHHHSHHHKLVGSNSSISSSLLKSTYNYRLYLLNQQKNKLKKQLMRYKLSKALSHQMSATNRKMPNIYGRSGCHISYYNNCSLNKENHELKEVPRNDSSRKKSK